MNIINSRGGCRYTPYTPPPPPPPGLRACYEPPIACLDNEALKCKPSAHTIMLHALQILKMAVQATLTVKTVISELKCWSLKQGVDGRWTLSLFFSRVYIHAHEKRPGDEATLYTVTQLTVTLLGFTQVSCLAQALRLASRDYLIRGVGRS